MNINDRNNDVWRKLILGEINFNPSYMAVSLLLWRLRLKIKDDKSFESIEKAKNELFDLYLKSKDFPNAKEDLQILLKR